ncbi:uncharacterized protein LOC128556491 isoform X1 [Mercenaria mercenaria]|uniref:uncharacterized protein LOC128556491 isoform X1 n=2 Tax=Mercenaria mercenaria TaxID=6596 RepID=UPI00234EBAAE|nr:uncharacterized protein LOC128556491 isoform X1 [Mercenaria mercenaria]
MNLLQKNVLQGLFICLLTEMIVSKRSDNNKDHAKWNVNYYPKPTRGVKHLDMNLKCSNKYQLIDVEVIAGKKMFEDNQEEYVFGYTPSLIFNVNNCYWNQGCTITLPQDLMVTCVTVKNTDGKGAIVVPNEGFSSKTCAMENVQFLNPVHAKCIKVKVVKNICELKNGKPNCTNKLPKRKGMIKSHESFPWNYNETYRNLVWKYNFPLTDKKQKVLVIGLKSVHVCEDDRLVLRTNKGEMDIAEMEENKHLSFKKQDHGFLDLEFSVASDSKGCGGFLICYNEIKKKELNRYDGKKRNVCDNLFNKKALIPKLETTGVP